MQKLLAISGGVDSVCLLHFYCDDPEVIVAHFNHGTRPSSNDDEEFVKKLAKKYNKKFVVGHVKLGANVSEEKARSARYDFLRKIAKENNAEIYTAHHLDDLVESVTINLLRGTGWRGLVPLDADDIKRPFIEEKYDKNALLKYAAKHDLVFREDPTNHEDNYLRNRIREKFHELSSIEKSNFVELSRAQKNLKTEIDQILNLILKNKKTYQRAWFKNLDEEIALELLKFITKENQISLTRPELKNFLDAIKTYAPEKSFNLPKDRLVKIHKTYFVL